MSLVSFSRAASVVAFGILASGSAFAACTSPAGTAGDINYSTNNIMAYCNGTVWVNMGTNLSIGFGVLTTGDFCIATSGTQISCNIATINLSSQASGTLQAAQFPALTGDVTTSAGSLATSIGANAVTMGKIAQIAGLSVIGNSASGTGNVAAITGTANQTLIVNGAGTGLAFGALNLTSSAAVTGILPVSNGGTGDSTLTQYGVLLGNGTGAIAATSVGATGTVLIGNTGANPSFSASPSLTNLTLSGKESLTLGTDYTTVGSQADVNLGAYSAVRYNGAATATFYGIVAGSNGQILYLHNPSSYTLTLSNLSGSESTTANQIITGTNADLPVPTNTSVTLQYDATASKWRVTGSSNLATSSPAGSNTQVQFNNSGAFGASSNFVWDNTNGRVGIGTTTPAYSMDANTGTVAGLVMHVNTNALPINPGTTAAVTLNAAATGQAAYYSGSSVISGSSVLNLSGGNVGIGTASPAVALDLVGVQHESNNGIGAISTDGIVLQNTTAAANNAPQYSPRIHFDGRGWETGSGASQAVDFIEEVQPTQSTTSAAVGNLVWSNSINGGGYSPLMTLTSAGNVGIGTTSPQSALHAYNAEVQVGSSGASCSSANAGAMRYASNTMYYCNGSAWSPFSSSCSGSASGSDTSLASGLVAYWNFNEDSGIVANDDTGNGNVGAWQGTLGSQWTTGKLGYGGNFNGSNNAVAIPAKQWPQSGFTASAWIKPTALGSLIMAAYCSGTCSPQGAYLQFGIFSSGAVWSRIVQGVDSIYIERTTNSGAVAANQWSHVVMTWNGGTSNSSIAIYVNGAQSDTTNAGSGTFTAPYSGSNVPLWIGGQNYSGGNSFFPGVIDEVGIWNVALTGTQISTLYNSGSGNTLGSLVCPVVINYSGGFTN